MEIPLLIREIIEYYQYVKIHKEKMKQLIIEFHDKIKTYGWELNCDYLVWIPSLHIITLLSDSSWNKIYTINFTKNECKYMSAKYISVKYFYYSSGMNDLNAYREADIPLYRF
jgi:hypothetical protein